MLTDFIKKAVELGADALEVEYRDRQEQICAMCGSTGVGIGSVPSSTKQSERLFAEIASLKKARKVEVGGVVYAARVQEFDSFGETAYRIRLGKPTR